MVCLDKYCFDFERIPERYRVAESFEDIVRVYRGDIRGLEVEGIKSKAVQKNHTDSLLMAKSLIDEKEIQIVVDKHTYDSTGTILFPRGSPFISTSLNPEKAQVFATRKNTTIYEICIHANRAIACYDEYGKFGLCQEVLIFGEILSEEIRSVKINNDDFCSELFNPLTRRVLTLSQRESQTRLPRDQNNWRILNF